MNTKQDSVIFSQMPEKMAVNFKTFCAQGLGASEKKKIIKILYNTTRGRTHLLPFF